jgi:Protein of unknown function (DUF2914)
MKIFSKPFNRVRTRAGAYRQAYEKKLQKGRAFYQQKKQSTEQLYRRYEKYVPLAAFIVGFAWDNLTLVRIDSWLDNLILLCYTIVAGILIAMLGLVERGRLRHAWIINHLELITGATHFLLGGLLSSYVIFYFRSADLGKSFIFVALLVVLMLANEFLFHRLHNLKLLCTLYFFCCFAFLTFFLPVMTRVMSAAIFISSGLLSFFVTSLIVAVIYHGGLRAARRELVGMAWPPAVIFAALVFFYFQNWMPPVPLALKDGGIYRSVTRAGENYIVRYRQPAWWQFWKTDERHFAYMAGDTVYCFAAIFAPTDLRERIVHHWQLYTENGWKTTDKRGYAIYGGRDGGWRGYTYKRNLTEGEWRIEVKTEKGRLLGRIPLEIRFVQEHPQRIKIAYR